MSLTDAKNIVTRESHDNMLAYLTHFLPNDLPTVNKFS